MAIYTRVMTREEIIKESRKYVKLKVKEREVLCGLYTDIQAAFLAGAEFAYKHPINVWHDINEEPELGSNIIVIDKNWQWWDIQPYDGEYDGYGGLTGWRCCVAHYNDIQHWAYINDLLPKNK